MPNFDTTAATLSSVSEATGLLNAVRSCYTQAKATQRLMQKYQAGVDTKFVTAVNTLFSSAERTELAAMLTDINTLVTAWEASHQAALGLGLGGAL